jgi:hypothetical protein
MRIGSGKDAGSKSSEIRRAYLLLVEPQTSDILLRTPFVTFRFKKQLLSVKFVIQTSHNQ